MFSHLSINGQADGIWFLGVILFMLSGWLDLKSPSSVATKGGRPALVVGGTALLVLSAIYPVWMQPRLL